MKCQSIVKCKISCRIDLFNLENDLRAISSLKIEKYKKKFSNQKNIPRHPHWSGWCLIPDSIEFWLRGENRIHERLRYSKANDGWKKILLYP